MNAADIASRLGTSEATIVRFASAFGFEGFPGLRRFLQNILRDMVSPVLRMQNKLEDLGRGTGHILDQIVDMEDRSIRGIRETVRTEDFDAAVTAVLDAERVFVFGIGASRILAELIDLRLTRFGIQTRTLVASGREMLEPLLLLGPRDTLLACGFHRITGELAAVLKHARRVGSRRVLLTDIDDPALSACAHVTLLVRRGPIHSFHSMTAPMTVLNALVLSVAMKQPGESLECLCRLEESRKEYDLDPIGIL